MQVEDGHIAVLKAHTSAPISYLVGSPSVCTEDGYPIGSGLSYHVRTILYTHQKYFV